MLCDEIHRHVITLAPWDHHVLTTPWSFCVHPNSLVETVARCTFGLVWPGGIPALQQEKLCSFQKSHFRSLCIAMPIGETTVKPKTTRQTLQESRSTYLCGLPTRWFRNRLQPHFEKHNKAANPLASALFRLGKMYFSKEGFTKRVYCRMTASTSRPPGREPQTNLNHWTSPKKHTQVSRYSRQVSD